MPCAKNCSDQLARNRLTEKLIFPLNLNYEQKIASEMGHWWVSTKETQVQCSTKGKISHLHHKTNQYILLRDQQRFFYPTCNGLITWFFGGNLSQLFNKALFQKIVCTKVLTKIMRFTLCVMESYGYTNFTWIAVKWVNDGVPTN